MRKLMFILIASILVFSFGFIAVFATKTEEDATKPFAGETLTYIGIDWIGTQVLRDKVGEFEEMTGATVNFDILEWSAFAEKLFLTLNSGSSTYDLVNLDYTWSGSLTAHDHLEPYPLDKWKADPEFDFDDIFPSYTGSLGTSMGEEGNLYIVPFVTDIIGLYYRTDLFEEYADEFKAEYGYNLKVPIYWDEFLDVAKFFTMDRDGDGEIDLHGTTMMAAPVAIASDYVIYAHGFGFDYFTEDLRPDYLQPLSIEATQFYIDLYRKWKVVPKSSPNNWFTEVPILLQRDQVATAVLWAAFMESVNDPEQSKVAGKVAFAPLPRRREMDTPGGLLGGHGLSIPKYSEHKEAALAFVEWVMSKEYQDENAMRGATGGRYSSTKKAASKYPWMSPYADAVMTGKPWTRTIFPDYFTVHHTDMSEELSKALAGELTVKEALTNVQNRVYKIMEEAGYYD
jgi:multiple sugar transport system substrate-binding protein